MKIAMWSGPRNLSTAMMYSFASRQDTEVMDEPFYAAYLAATGHDHPMKDRIIESGEIDPQAVISACLSAPVAAAHSYQKHMCHHMIDGFDRHWIAAMTNVFLIRHPARVLASYSAKRENPTLTDIGFEAQAELYSDLRALGQNPVVIDSATIRAAPESALRALCEAIALPFDPAMLHWEKGGHPADGVWAKHWYGSVWNSTGFAGVEGPLPDVSHDHAQTFAAALEIYEALVQEALRP